MTIREQILIAIGNALNAAGKPAGLNVHRERTWPIEGDTMPAILFYARDDVPESTSKEKSHGPLVLRGLEVALECRAVGSPPDTALDPLIQWATAQMFLDEKFGGLSNSVEEGRTEWSSKSGETPRASATIFFVVRYRTARVDPSKKS